MVMASRPEVRTASLPIAAVDLMGLAQQMTNALARVPFRDPLRGPAGTLHNLGQTVTREVVRTFMGYSSGLPIEEFRSIEFALDQICKLVMAPVVVAEGADSHQTEVNGVPGYWYRPRDVEPLGRILYLHGGGYVGTSPLMYAYFTALLATSTQCEVFVADYRLAPEFPFPAGLEDAVAVLEQWLEEGVDPGQIFLAGDSGGGGLATSVVFATEAEHLPQMGGLVLFSPEVDLKLDEPSVTDNADLDILPWNIPTSPYLHGADATSAAVSALYQDVSRWPSTFIAYGADEMFRDPIRTLVGHLQQAGVETVDVESEGMFHVFPILMPWADASRKVYRTVGQFVRRHITEIAPVGGPDAVPVETIPPAG